MYKRCKKSYIVQRSNSVFIEIAAQFMTLSIDVH